MEKTPLVFKNSDKIKKLDTHKMSSTDIVVREVCDEDYDGISSFDLATILDEFQTDNDVNLIDEDVVYIAKSWNGLIKVVDVSTNPTIVNVCGTNSSLYEVAVDQEQEVYVSTSNGILHVDTDNCNYQRLGSLPNNSNIAMSFDTQNNLYVGGRSSKVYRADAGQFTNFTEWYDFNNGQPGGDFVVIGEYMYIAWELNNNNYLYKVTLDSDNQLVSYTNLGQIEDDTYGMAAENGRLYGVTPYKLYEIDLETIATTTVIQNPSSVPWYGAAGLHEAIAFSYSIHEDYNDALTGDNPLGDTYENTTPFNQIVYIRILEENSGNVEIVELHLIVNTPPETTPATLPGCSTNGNFGIFDLTTALSEMVADLNGIDVTFYLNQSDAENEVNAIQNLSNFQSTEETQTIYVRFQNGECFSIDTITLQNQTNSLTLTSPLSFCAGDRITIEAPTGFNSYTWSGLQGNDLATNDIHAEQISVSNPGIYELTVTFGTNCSLTSQVEVIEESGPSFSDQNLNFCSDNTVVNLDVDQIIQELEQMESSYHYTLYANTVDAESGLNSLHGTLQVNDGETYVIQTRENANDACFTLSSLTINIGVRPEFDWIEEHNICEGEEVDISIPNIFDSYNWFNLSGDDLTNNDTSSNAVTLTQEGTYTVTVENDGCEVTKEVTIEFNPLATVQDIVVEGNTATIIAMGDNLEYSLDNVNWTSNPTFIGLENGVFTAYVKSEALCGGDQRNFTLFSITNVITPNGDGYNDTWGITGFENYPDSSIQIYDRYGKLLVDEQLDSNFLWNGTYNGEVVSTGSYWYVLEISDGRKFTGFITVKNY